MTIKIEHVPTPVTPDDVDGKTLPRNVLLVGAVPSASQTDEPNAGQPVAVRSVLDVARRFRPSIEVTLQSECADRAPERVSVDYDRALVTERDLLGHFEPDWVMRNARTRAGPNSRFGVPERQRIKAAALRQAASDLAEGPAGDVCDVAKLRARLQQEIQRLAEVLGDLHADCPRVSATEE